MPPLHDRKAGPRELHAHIKIQPQRRAHIHVVFGLEVKVARRAPAAHFDVVLLARAHGHAFVRQVGHGQQQGGQLGLDGFQALGRGIEFILERGNLGLGGFGGLFSPLPMSWPICLES